MLLLSLGGRFVRLVFFFISALLATSDIQGCLSGTCFPYGLVKNKILSFLDIQMVFVNDNSVCFGTTCKLIFPRKQNSSQREEGGFLQFRLP